MGSLGPRLQINASSHDSSWKRYIKDMVAILKKGALEKELCQTLVFLK